MRRIPLALVLLFLSSIACAEPPLRGRVVDVKDGDSFVIVDALNEQHRVRLVGIDAPERRQPFATVSKQALRDLIHGKEVEIHPVKRDQYGRFIAKAIIGGRDAGLEQLRAGNAWFYTHYERDVPRADRDAYLTAARQARAAGKGLWSDPRAMPPWQFRREARSPSTRPRS